MNKLIKVEKTPIDYQEFNKIPHVTLTHDFYDNTINIRKNLEKLLNKYNLDKYFKPCTFHRHVEIKENEILLVENLKLNDGEIHPISYYVTFDGIVKAYKFALGPDPLKIDDIFFKEYCDLLIKTNEYSRISIKRPTGNNITEMEIPEYRATVLFPIKYDDIMNDSIQHSTSTGETHLSTTHGTHRVLFKKKPYNIIGETVFPYLQSVI